MNNRAWQSKKLHVSLALTAAVGLAAACQGYRAEEVDPLTVVAVETYESFGLDEPPVLLVLQDRSGSMDACFDAEPGMGPAQGCLELPSLETFDSERRSRMDVARQVMIELIHDSHQEVRYGLVSFGADEADPLCGGPAVLTDPSTDPYHVSIDAFASHPDLTRPRGGTPAAAALRSAYDILVDPTTGRPLQEDRQNFVVLVTDGLMNCNEDHALPCVCGQERGCPTADPNVRLAFGEEGDPLDPRLCLDDREALDAVDALFDAGIRTFVVGLGEVFDGDPAESALSQDVLNRLAEHGGVPNEEGPLRFYSAADAEEFQETLQRIVTKISVPCEFSLGGPVCDGRLLQLSLRIDGEVIETSCDESGSDDTWFFAEDGAGYDPTRIVFSPNICERLREVEEGEIAIKGLENACAVDAPRGPACSLAD